MFKRRSSRPVVWEEGTTQREEVPWWRVQSAVPTPEQAGNGTHASAPAPTRAGAREGNDQTAHPQPQSAAHSASTQSDEIPPPTPADTPLGDPVPAGFPAPPPPPPVRRRSRRVAAVATWWGVTAPDWWAQPRPSLERIGWYAKRGEWTTPTGLYRFIGLTYHYVVALPCVATLYALAWIAQSLGASLWRLPEISPPNDIHADDLTAPAQVWTAVTAGLAAMTPGPRRTAGLTYAYAAIPVITCCYAAAWTVERFWRLAAVATLPALLLGLIP